MQQEKMQLNTHIPIYIILKKKKPQNLHQMHVAWKNAYCFEAFYFTIKKVCEESCCLSLVQALSALGTWALFYSSYYIELLFV